MTQSQLCRTQNPSNLLPRSQNPPPSTSNQCKPNHFSTVYKINRKNLSLQKNWDPSLFQSLFPLWESATQAARSSSQKQAVDHTKRKRRRGRASSQAVGARYRPAFPLLWTRTKTLPLTRAVRSFVPPKTNSLVPSEPCAFFALCNCGVKHTIKETRQAAALALVACSPGWWVWFSGPRPTPQIDTCREAPQKPPKKSPPGT